MLHRRAFEPFIKYTIIDFFTLFFIFKDSISAIAQSKTQKGKNIMSKTQKLRLKLLKLVLIGKLDLELIQITTSDQKSAVPVLDPTEGEKSKKENEAKQFYRKEISLVAAVSEENDDYQRECA